MKDSNAFFWFNLLFLFLNTLGCICTIMEGIRLYRMEAKILDVIQTVNLAVPTSDRYIDATIWLMKQEKNNGAD